jgi:hypothetical protein
VAKEFADGDRPVGSHRFDVAQGFRPVSVRVVGSTVEQVIDRASERMGKRPGVIWRSVGMAEWCGPPAVWMQWAG